MKMIARITKYLWVWGMLAGFGGMLLLTPRAQSQGVNYDLYYFQGQYSPTNPCQFNFSPVMVFMSEWPGAVDWEYRLATCVLNRDGDPTNDDRIIAAITDDPVNKNCSFLSGGAYRDLPSNNVENYTDHIGKNHVLTCMRSDFPFPPNIPPAIASAGNWDWQTIPAGKCPAGSQNNPAFSFFGEFIGLNYVATCAYGGQWLGPLTLSCSGRPNPALRRGEARVRWVATAGGGTGSYTYDWLRVGDAVRTTPASPPFPIRVQNVDAVYNTLGQKEAEVRVTSGPAQATATCRVNVLDFDIKEK